ncbi:uncharacterized protein GGS22DRAFT_191048 [Annulohypoxylon maeteangense]|uniref:uncharacterized protein n=1 Tax=Annulohypoxylon maeteangense TaxID=1927788 RepID=UPI0020085AC2|nr:uncharacterized protein GGS22DRAFT_191048 [Annulohypoxylon maeteangense]KAI0882461.1 hypothetical protein GGS22DRAFT_191048 [Annulohypoxylon maeteangense]
MPVLTRKRKAELEAAERVPEQPSPETEHAAEEHLSKRQKRDDPFKRIDPFRPLSPRPKTVLRRRDQMKLFMLKKKPFKPQRPLPTVFFTVPEADPARQISAKSRSTNDVDTIIATKSLFEHVDKYGVEAMPSRETLESWLRENKDEFIQAREKRARQQPTPTRRIQAEGQVIGPIRPELETPAAHHPAARPPTNQPVAPVANGGIVRRVIRRARRTVNRLLNRAVAVLDETLPAETVLVRHIHEDHQVCPGHPLQLVQLARMGIEPEHVRPIAPPLDPRFFHPNGQLHSVYKYLTAQIPLPRQWTRWALNNGITDVPGRGNIGDHGTYVADDTFDYDALYQAIHRGHFRTGRIEIDSHTDHWPGVEGRKDDVVVDLELDEFRAPKEEEEEEEKYSHQLRKEQGAPPSPSSHMLPHGSPGPPPSCSTYRLPDSFSDTTDCSTTQAD